MKSCTDLEQSKKLAEFLPIETADMHYSTCVISNGEFIVSPNYGQTIKSMQEDYGSQIIPCWSLASLLEYLRKIDLFPEIIDSGDCVLTDISFYDDEDGKVIHPMHSLRAEGKTILDTCYAMIIKLHELKLV